ncbi:MAG: arylamine N-acetyltransferase [Planctomycetes bacterium]|nr:arylamine N-acetyltransferase [Planctomycetota bacterium]
MSPEAPFATPEQVARYLARVGVDAAATTAGPTGALLATLHEAHLRAIPFENLEIHLGRPMRIEPDALFEDLVDRRRGGYCFQMNELLALVLTALGFRVERFAARVWFGNPMPLPPRSHQCLRVTDGAGGRWFCDVGFGGATPLLPVPWRFDAPCEQPLSDYRLTRHAKHGVMVQTRLPSERSAADAWQDMISFDELEQFPIDFKLANFAISTMPGSKFVVQRLASFVVGDTRMNVQDGALRRIRPAGVTVDTLAPADEARLLRETFGLDLPPALPWL